jgi:hypothetical protein
MLSQAKILDAKRFVYRYADEHFPRYAVLTIDVRHYPGFGWGRMYAVHAALADGHYYKADGLHRSLTGSLREALERIHHQFRTERPQDFYSAQA